MNWRPLIKVAQWVGAIAALAVLVRTVVRAWDELSAHELAFDPIPGLVAVALLTVTYLGFAGIWKATARALGTKIAYGDTLQLWSFSNLARYLPGKIWQVVGLVVLARDLGVPPGVTTAVAVVALAFMIGTGALVGLILMPGAFLANDWARICVWILAVGMLVPILRPGVIAEVLRRLPKSLGCRDVRAFSRGEVIQLTVLFAVVWLAHGATFHLLCTAFGPVAWDQYPKFAGAYALAYVSGLVAVFAPGGLGVREGVLASLLSTGPETALPVHAIAVAARVWTLLGELLLLAFAFGFRLRRKRT